MSAGAGRRRRRRPPAPPHPAPPPSRRSDVDKVDEVMDEVNEQMATAQEISNAISQPIGGQLFDEVRAARTVPRAR